MSTKLNYVFMIIMACAINKVVLPTNCYQLLFEEGYLNPYESAAMD